MASPHTAVAASAPILYANLGRVLYFARKAAESIAAFSRADLTSRTNLLFLAAAQALSGATADTIKTAERALAATGSAADAKSLHALVVRLWVAQGDSKKALTVGKTAAAETKDPSLWQLFYAVASQADNAEATRLATANLPNSAVGANINCLVHYIIVSFL